MDIRTPTHELTRAHAVLRARRRIFTQKRDWALSRPGLLALRGREGQGGNGRAPAELAPDSMPRRPPSVRTTMPAKTLLKTLTRRTR